MATETDARVFFPPDEREEDVPNPFQTFSIKITREERVVVSKYTSI